MIFLYTLKVYLTGFYIIVVQSKVMILGYDVYHCAERKGESVGALVATTSDNLAKYFSVVSFHKDKSELSSNMCLDTKSKWNIPS